MRVRWILLPLHRVKLSVFLFLALILGKLTMWWL